MTPMQVIILIVAFLITSVSSATLVHKLHKENLTFMIELYRRIGLRGERLAAEEKRLKNMDLIDLLFERYDLEQQIKYK